MTAASVTTVAHYMRGARQELHVVTEATNSGYTFDVDLSAYGATTITGIIGMVQTTAGSVVVQEQPTTSVTDTTLTVTIGGSSVDGKVREYYIQVAQVN